jgi:hypothetical protein
MMMGHEESETNRKREKERPSPADKKRNWCRVEMISEMLRGRRDGERREREGGRGG